MMTSQQTCPFLLDLGSPEATLDRVGGKGASLARMVAAGLPVPPGFHITTDAYDRFVAENHLGDGILSAVAQAQADAPATLERASEQIQSVIAQGTIPGDIAEMIRQRYANLGADAPVAVRSSATAEDLPEMSFAGQLETYLNVRGGDEVIHAVKRCWASLWTGRAIGYRQRQGIRPEDVSIAVVVQQLIPAEAAGVLFTANPVTGARDELMINAAWGLGEAIVSGRVTPDTIVKRKGDPPVLTFLLGFDSAPMLAEKSLYDLAIWARGQDELAGYLTRTGGKEIAAAYETRSTPLAGGESWREFTQRLGEHLNRFGHAVYDLDFANSVPADAPASLIETLKYFVAGQGRNPYERQAAAAAAREQATGSVLTRLRGPRLRLFRWALRWAQRSAPLREDMLADAGLGWPALRRMLREVGRRMVAAGAIAEADEVFWLKWEEVEVTARLLDAGEPGADFRSMIADRRETWQREHSVTPPVVLPVKGGARFFGLDLSSWMPARSNQAAGSIIKGIGASPGRVTGPACVIHGPEEFDQMKPDDILVAKITTPAWTPLFALASGIVTDVGGPLSHSSIVAREYGVPAVLGTGVATHRIRGGQHITVDGDAGVVTLGG